MREGLWEEKRDDKLILSNCKGPRNKSHGGKCNVVLFGVKKKKKTFKQYLPSNVGLV